MTFLGLLSRLQKQTKTINKQDVTVILGVKEMKQLCQNKPDWDYVVIPLALKTGSTHSTHRKLWLVANTKKRKEKTYDTKAKLKNCA